MSWFFRPVAMGRIAALRFFAYAFILIDWWLYSPWILGHRHLPGELYQPLFIGRVLALPAPTHSIVVGTLLVVLAAALLAMLNIAPRLLGWVVAFSYFQWMIIAMSYGKVDHDRFAFLVLLFVLPTLRKARWGDTTRLSHRAGWAVNLVQIAVVCTYVLAAFAKFRFGGIEWVNSATMARAIVRRGTDFSTWMLDFPWLLHTAQWGIVGFELLSPVVLFIAWPRARYAIVAFFYGFHLLVYVTVATSFLPHLVAMTCFFPLEKINPRALVACVFVWLRGAPHRKVPTQRRPQAHAAADNPPASSEAQPK
ncbi:hypothetical protein [Natronoglycomyces albus]|uniref:HTTM domain-containing protein n=1 Tax=Natronoglycomyces albus TaxID=2811108 RepID=A0A895XNU6_9ACTN|nr:hypothetical protein [Natronoglycomyces albus]QSB06807.1 hypothetical protein JQS30_07945 [Natronoglycomyces albus]